MTLNLFKGRLWKGGACTKPVPLGQATGTSTTCPSMTGRLGQALLVPVGQARCLYQTCPTGTGTGQKRPVLVPWTGHRPTLEAFLVTGQALCPRLNLSQSNMSQLVPQSGTTRPCTVSSNELLEIGRTFVRCSYHTDFSKLVPPVSIEFLTIC